MKINLWIDDDRHEPDGWLRVTDCTNAIMIIGLYGPHLNAISFDHDIGMKGNGADVAEFIKTCALGLQMNPAIFFNIHSGNPRGAKNIHKILSDVYKEWGRNADHITYHPPKIMWGAGATGFYAKGLKETSDFTPTMP